MLKKSSKANVDRPGSVVEERASKRHCTKGSNKTTAAMPTAATERFSHVLIPQVDDNLEDEAVAKALQIFKKKSSDLLHLRDRYAVLETELSNANQDRKAIEITYKYQVASLEEQLVKERGTYSTSLELLRSELAAKETRNRQLEDAVRNARGGTLTIDRYEHVQRRLENEIRYLQEKDRNTHDQLNAKTQELARANEELNCSRNANLDLNIAFKALGEEIESMNSKNREHNSSIQKIRAREQDLSMTSSMLKQSLSAAQIPSQKPSKDAVKQKK